MHWGRWHLQAQSCHGYYFCCVVWGKYRVCRAAFCVKLWMLGFGFDMSERMSEDMSESMSKDMSEKLSEDMSERVSNDLSERMSKDMSERCQKECQKICQKKCQKDMSEDMSEIMSKDRSERMSEDCFQSVCEVESNRTHFRRWVVCLPSPDPIRLTYVRWMRQPVWVVQERNIVTKAHLTSITKPRTYSQWQPSPDNLHPTCHGGDHSK